VTVALLVLGWFATLPHGGLAVDAGIEGNRTNASNSTNCTAELKIPAFKRLVDESCLASLAAVDMPDGRCPRDVAEDFLGAVFAQHDWMSLLVMPWAWAAYVILLGMSRIPKGSKHDETSFGAQLWAFVWLVSQSVSIISLVAAWVMLMFVYLKYTQDLYPCAPSFTAWILSMPSLTKIGPLLLAGVATQMFADEHPRYKAFAATFAVISQFWFLLLRMPDIPLSLISWCMGDTEVCIQQHTSEAQAAGKEH